MDYPRDREPMARMTILSSTLCPAPKQGCTAAAPPFQTHPSPTWRVGAGDRRLRSRVSAPLALVRSRVVATLPQRRPGHCWVHMREGQLPGMSAGSSSSEEGLAGARLPPRYATVAAGQEAGNWPTAPLPPNTLARVLGPWHVAGRWGGESWHPPFQR